MDSSRITGYWIAALSLTAMVPSYGFAYRSRKVDSGHKRWTALAIILTALFLAGLWCTGDFFRLSETSSVMTVFFSLPVLLFAVGRTGVSNKVAQISMWLATITAILVIFVLIYLGLLGQAIQENYYGEPERNDVILQGLS